MPKKKSLSGYQLTRSWFDFAYGNHEVKPNDGILYMYLIELNNRLGWRESFGVTSSDCMSSCGFTTRRQFRSALDNLIKWGFVKVVHPSKNQFQCNVISITNACAESAQAQVQAKAQAVAHAQAQAEALFIKPITIKQGNRFSAPTVSEVVDYFIQNGFTEALATEAFILYNTNNWHDTKGNRIKDWKAKMRKVWFKNNAKINRSNTSTTMPVEYNDEEIPFKTPQVETFRDQYYNT